MINTANIYQELHVRKLKKNYMNNPEEVKELSTLWPSIHSNLYNLIYKNKDIDLGSTHRKLFCDFLHFDCIVFLSSGGKIFDFKSNKILEKGIYILQF